MYEEMNKSMNTMVSVALLPLVLFFQVTVMGWLLAEMPTHVDDKTCFFVYRWILFCFMTHMHTWQMMLLMHFTCLLLHEMPIVSIAAKLFVCSFVFTIVCWQFGRVRIGVEEMFLKLC